MQNVKPKNNFSNNNLESGIQSPEDKTQSQDPESLQTKAKIKMTRNLCHLGLQ
jgi:hypothetical protein